MTQRSCFKKINCIILTSNWMAWWSRKCTVAMPGDFSLHLVIFRLTWCSSDFSVHSCEFLQRTCLRKHGCFFVNFQPFSIRKQFIVFSNLSFWLFSLLNCLLLWCCPMTVFSFRCKNTAEEIVKKLLGWLVWNALWAVSFQLMNEAWRLLAWDFQASAWSILRNLQCYECFWMMK